MLASMLPPERSAQTGPSPSTFPASSAATEAAPAPSTVSLQRSLTRRIAPRDLRVGDGDDALEPAVEEALRQLARAA